MRIRVDGDCDSAKAVRGYLADGGFLVDDDVYSYSVCVEETDSPVPVVDGIHCKLESEIVNAIAQLANTQVILDRPGANRSDRSIKIGVPVSFTTQQKDAVERGVRGGFENMLKAPAEVLAPVAPQPSAAAPIPVLDVSEVCRKLDAILTVLSAKPEAPRSWWQRLFS